MFPGQGGYQPQYQPTFSHAAQRSGPPPAKKPKGNPIITRYPPPPGYQGPLQSQALHQQKVWPQAGQAAYSHGAAGYPSLTQQPYGPTHAYPQQSWPGQPLAQQPLAAGYSLPSAQSFFAAETQAYPLIGQSHQSSSSYPQSAPPQTMFQIPAISSQKTSRQNSAPLLGSQMFSNDFLDGNGDPLPPPDLTDTTGNELEHDFDSECYFARHPDEVNPELSLGQLLWCAPQPTRRALPGVFAEAELEAIAPRHPFPADEESVSEYFIKNKREETLLSVRQTDLWHDVKHDLIYKEFPALTKETLLRPILIERYRNRPDPNWSRSDFMRVTSPSSDLSRSSSPATKAEQGNEQHDSVIEVDYEHESDHARKSGLNYEQDDVLGSLEQAIYSTEPHAPQDYPATKKASHSRTHTRGNSHSHSRHHSRSHSRSYSRASSVSSTSGQKITRPVPLPPVHDQNQEEILAALGVTGEARLVYQTPGPAFGPPPNQATLSHSRHGSMTSNQGTRKVLQSQQHPQALAYDPWNPHTHDHGRGTHERTSSVHSQQTVSGSDFQLEDSDITPRPTTKRMDTRKRGFEDDDVDATGDFEPTPKPKKGRTQFHARSTFV